LSTLAVPDVSDACDCDSVHHYNFASPPVGDPVYTDVYNAAGVVTFRLVNTCDLVPAAPTAVFGDLL
jgi:hypothetical protein